MTSNKNFYITTPIYYVNDSPHIGHAYTTIACDVMARFKRLDGFNVKFLTGTDEHGQKVDKAAKDKGINPQDFVDEVSTRFQNLVSKPDRAGNENLLNISNTDFIRTTEGRHKKAAQALWQKLVDNGHIYLDKYAGWYSVRDEAYYQESELVNGKAPTGAEIEWVEEESYFFDLSKWQEKLLKYYDQNPDFIFPKSRFNEVYSFVKGGLKDLSISRTTFNWGVPLPESAGSHKHVMYVWIDALTNYLTSCGYPDLNAAEMQSFWSDKSRPIHVVGKDIIRFHAVYWPAFLMAADLPVPSQIIAHGWWTIEGEKMSKSIGNVIAPQDLVQNYGLEQTRYFMLKAMPFGNDGDFSRERLVEVVNADLANNIGNLAQRTLSLIQKNSGGKIPAKPVQIDFSAEQVMINFRQFMNEFKYQDALFELTSYASKANEYIDTKAPWTLKKEGKIEEMEAVLYNLLEAIRHIAIMLQPFCPVSANKILDYLGVENDAAHRNFQAIFNKEAALKSGQELPAPSGVFMRLG
jgi:methionyl-tRNA synthetase